LEQFGQMAAVLDTRAVPVTGDRPVVIVGSGPVGVRAAQELYRRDPGMRIVLYGAECREPYNRVRLSSYLAGELDWDALTRDLDLPSNAAIERRLGCAVVAVDRTAQAVVDARGHVQPYDRLVLATGSAPHVPDIPGINLPGVFTFRDFEDAQQLFARSVRSRCTVVLGGGLLGLEAARAMRRFHTDIVVVEQAPRLMPQQLDDDAAELLRRHVERLGIEVLLGDGVRRIAGDARVSAVQLRSGATIECDTLVVATGIRPRIELARAAGLAVGRGIRVDDRLLTSDPHIHAVGECAEHRDIVYGLVAPGLEQATVAATLIAGGSARYLGSTAATRLKVLDLPVFSIGRARDEDRLDLARRWVYRASDGAKYCKVVTERGCVIGAMTIGDVPDLGRLQEAATHARRVWPWQLWRLRKRGSLWPQFEGEGVAAWPATVTVCNCTGVTRGELSRALANGCATVAALAARTGASTV
jgi:nitrite reductase (NADH) large subunit